jgi:hypothetical protein
MVNAPKMNVSPLPAGQNGKSTKRATQRHHQTNEGKSGLQAKRVRALGALRSLRSKKKLVAEKRRETHFLSHEEKEKSIEDFVDRATAGARKRYEDPEAAVQQEQDDMMHAELAGLKSRQPEKEFAEKLVAIRDSLSDLASSDNVEHGEDEDDEVTEQGMLSEDDQPGWVMGTITKTVQQHMKRLRQKQKTFDKLTQPEWEDAANCFRERDKKCGTSNLRVPAFVQPEMIHAALPSPPTTFAELIESPRFVRRKSQGTSRPGSSHIRIDSVKL